MNVFNYVGDAEIKHLNIRKQGNEDDRELAVDVKLFLERVPAEVAAPLLGVESVEDFTAAFWTRDEEPAPRFNGLDGLSVWTFYERKHDVRMGKTLVRAEKLSKFAITVHDKGKVSITFSVSILGPSDYLVQFLADNMMELIHIELKADPGLFDEQAAA